MTEPRLHLSDDPAAAVGELLADQVLRGGSIVLTGGTSIGAAYEHAAAAQADWHSVSLWWGDERGVPPDDPRSNYGLARRTLLDRLERLPEVHRIRGELDPSQAARRYDDELDGVGLDLLLLSLGPDGHVASLFPSSPQLLERGVRVTSGPGLRDPFVERITLTLPAILSAARIVLLAAGAAKAPALDRAVRGAVDPSSPASLLREGATPVEVYCDRAAAGLGGD
jgi:6-phosphogluconolactonase